MNRNDVFEFDNQKYKATQIPLVTKMLEEEVERDNQTCLKLDHEAFLYFFQEGKRQNRHQELQAAYDKIFQQQKLIRAFGELIERLQGYHHRMNTKEKWTEAEINGFNSGAGDLEKHFKGFLKDVPPSMLETMADQEEFQRFHSDQLNYMRTSTFSPEGFEKLTGRMFQVLGVLHQHRIQALKAMAEMQLVFVPERLVNSEL